MLALHGAMSFLRYCKRKGGGEAPSPKRSRLKTIIDGKERDGVVQSDEGEGMLRYPLRKQGREHRLKYLTEKGMFVVCARSTTRTPLLVAFAVFSLGPLSVSGQYAFAIVSVSADTP